MRATPGGERRERKKGQPNQWESEKKKKRLREDSQVSTSSCRDLVGHGTSRRQHSRCTRTSHVRTKVCRLGNVSWERESVKTKGEKRIETVILVSTGIAPRNPRQARLGVGCWRKQSKNRPNTATIPDHWVGIVLLVRGASNPPWSNTAKWDIKPDKKTRVPRH